MRRDIILSIGFIFMMQGCGHKGPLVLPAPKAQFSKTSATYLYQPNSFTQRHSK